MATKIAKKVAKRVGTTATPRRKVVARRPAAVSAAKTKAARMPPLDPAGDSDLAIAMRELVAGGETRQDVMHRVAHALENRTTRSGRPKPVSTIINHALNRALTHGWVIESRWRLVPDPNYTAPQELAEPTAAKKASDTSKV